MSPTKLCIIIRKDLPTFEDCCVQAGHAVAEWCLVNGDHRDPRVWLNGTLVYLQVETYDELLYWFKKLKERLYENMVTFWEEDLDNTMTAIACEVNNNDTIFNKLEKLSFAMNQPQS